MLAVAVYSGLYVAELRAREVHASGAVTALNARTTPDGVVLYYPVVTFRLPDGARYSTELVVGSHPPTYTADQVVTVIFDPTHPEQARIASWFSLPDLWIVPAITAVLGVAFLLAASLTWWIGRQFS